MRVRVVADSDIHLHFVIQKVVKSTDERLLEEVSEDKAQAKRSSRLESVVHVIRLDHGKRNE